MGKRGGDIEETFVFVSKITFIYLNFLVFILLIVSGSTVFIFNILLLEIYSGEIAVNDVPAYNFSNI
jgi:hypothetical protein